MSEFLADNDVVLTDYENLRKNHIVYGRIHWHRIVLDECQEIKVATNKIASQVCPSVRSTIHLNDLCSSLCWIA